MSANWRVVPDDELMSRLRAAGKYSRFGERRQELSAMGLSQKDAAQQARYEFLVIGGILDGPPCSSGTAPTLSKTSMAKIRKARAKMPLPSRAASDEMSLARAMQAASANKVASMPACVRWALQNLYAPLETIDPDSVPAPEAVTMLVRCRESPELADTLVARSVSAQTMDDAAQRGRRSDEDQIEDMERVLNDFIQDLRNGLEEDSIGSERHGGEPPVADPNQKAGA